MHPRGLAPTEAAVPSASSLPPVAMGTGAGAKHVGLKETAAVKRYESAGSWPMRARRVVAVTNGWRSVQRGWGWGRLEATAARAGRLNRRGGGACSVIEFVSAPPAAFHTGRHLPNGEESGVRASNGVVGQLPRGARSRSGTGKTEAGQPVPGRRGGSPVASPFPSGCRSFPTSPRAAGRRLPWSRAGLRALGGGRWASFAPACRERPAGPGAAALWPGGSGLRRAAPSWTGPGRAAAGGL